MGILDYTRLVVYRFHEKGLEVFLINTNLMEDPDVWKLPILNVDEFQTKMESEEYIEVDIDSDHTNSKLVAIEGDWHNIPSIRGLIKHDIKVVKTLVKEAVPGLDKGSFFAFKEVVKKLLPNEYKALKELKEILVESNSIRNI